MNCIVAAHSNKIDCKFSVMKKSVRKKKWQCQHALEIWKFCINSFNAQVQKVMEILGKIDKVLVQSFKLYMESLRQSSHFITHKKQFQHCWPTDVSYSRSQVFIANTTSTINSGNAYVHKEKPTRPSVRFTSVHWNYRICHKFRHFTHEWRMKPTLPSVGFIIDNVTIPYNKEY